VRKPERKQTAIVNRRGKRSRTGRNLELALEERRRVGSGFRYSRRAGGIGAKKGGIRGMSGSANQSI